MMKLVEPTVLVDNCCLFVLVELLIADEFFAKEKKIDRCRIEILLLFLFVLRNEKKIEAIIFSHRNEKVFRCVFFCC